MFRCGACIATSGCSGTLLGDGDGRDAQGAFASIGPDREHELTILGCVEGPDPREEMDDAEHLDGSSQFVRELVEPCAGRSRVVTSGGESFDQPGEQRTSLAKDLLEGECHAGVAGDLVERLRCCVIARVIEPFADMRKCPDRGGQQADVGSCSGRCPF